MMYINVSIYKVFVLFIRNMISAIIVNYQKKNCNFQTNVLVEKLQNLTFFFFGFVDNVCIVYIVMQVSQPM